MKIVKLQAKDVLRLRAVEITPEGNLVTLGGKNGAGKSSVLDAIALALGGKRATPEVPIRRGAKKAEVVLDLGDLVVERAITQGGDRLVVRGADGQPVRSPQAALDRIVGAIALDPLAFSRMPAREQAESLRGLLGIDTATLDAERERVFAERTAVNRDGQAAKARLDRMPRHDDAPAGEVSIAALTEDLERRRAVNDANAVTRGEAQVAVRERERARAAVAQLQRDLAGAVNVLDGWEQRVAETATAAAAAKDVDVDGVRAQIAGAEENNRKVRDNAAHAAATAALEAAREQSRALSARLDAIDGKKAAALATVTFPVPGLGFGDDGTVTLDGLPFAQASTAEKLRVSVAMACAANPELRVFFVRDGSLLDADSLRLIAEMAAAQDAQVWVEDARTSDPEAIIIEDGTVKEPAVKETR